MVNNYSGRSRRERSSWKDHFRQLRNRRKVQRQGEQKKKSDDFFKTEDDRFKRIGSGNDYSTDSFYHWSTMQSNYLLSKEDEIPRLRSLKEICSMEIAENYDMLSQELLRTGNWTLWSTAWKYVVRWRRDNFKTFQIFAEVFYDQKGFSCHDDLRHYPHSKYKTLLASSVRNGQTHRMERLYSNIKFAGFIRTINHCRFNNLVALEISKDLSDDELIQLTNISNLTALKVVQKKRKLEDTIINSWCSALKSAKWAKLQVLCLPQISEASMIKLQNQATKTKLLYIEVSTPSSTFNVPVAWPNVDLKNWTYNKEKGLLESPLALKLQMLLDKTDLKKRSVPLTSSAVLLDFNIVDREFQGPKLISSQREFDELWNLGEISGSYIGFMLKKWQNIKEEDVPKIHGTTRNHEAKRLKKNPKKTSARSFFDL